MVHCEPVRAEPPAGGPARGSHLPGLDGLRGIAVMAVIAYHLDVPFAPRGGAIGVTLFFALSGFLITTLLLREVDAAGRPRLLAFYARRALRLLPALLLVLAAVRVYAAVDPSPVGDQTVGVLPYVLLYVGNWYRAVTGFGSLGLLEHTWSLSVEEQFYVVWPLVLAGVVLAVRAGRRTLLVVALVGSVAPLLVRLALWHGTASGARVYNGTDTALDPLMMGCALALLLSLSAGSPVPGRLLRWAVWPAALLMALDAVVRLGGHTPGAVTFDLLWGPTVFGLASAVVVGATVLRPATWLRWAPLRQVGVVSYGLYLWHYPVVRVLRDHDLRGATGGVLVVLVTAVLAGASYVLVERPVLRLARYVPPARPVVPAPREVVAA